MKHTKKELEKLTVKELREIAKEEKVSLSGKSVKGEILEILFSATGKTQKGTKAVGIEPKPLTAPAKKATAKKSSMKSKEISRAEAQVPVSFEKAKLSTNGRKRSKFENLDNSIIEQAAKFYIAKEEPVYRNELPRFIPESYMNTHMKLFVRDPRTLFVYWHINEAIVNDAKGRLSSIEGVSLVLRVVRVNDGSFYELDVKPGVSSLYIESPNNDCPVKALLGLGNSLGEFSLVVESNVVYVPAEQLASASGTSTEDTLVAMSLGLSEEELEDMKSMGYERFRVGSEEFLKRKLEEQLSSHLVSSVSSQGLVKEAGERKFRLWVDAELIVYGGTEPDATVTIGGKKIELQKDGTFSFRMAFPDGEIPFPVVAEASDKKEEREIDLFFNRNTELFSPRFK